LAICSAPPVPNTAIQYGTRNPRRQLYRRERDLIPLAADYVAALTRAQQLPGVTVVVGVHADEDV
jgi:hypothetical protein